MPQHRPVAADGAGLDFVRVDVSVAEDLDRALDTEGRAGAQALNNGASGLLLRFRDRLAMLLIQYRLPTMTLDPLYAQAGVFMTYSPKGGPAGLPRRAAVYVDRILKRTRPSDLPIDQPREFDFLVNVRTARELGLLIPPRSRTGDGVD